MVLALPLWFDPVIFRGPHSGAQRLYYAILVDAVSCLLGLRGEQRHRAVLQREAREWVLGRQEVRVTFSHVCESLELPETKIRDLLLSEDPQIHFLMDRGHRLRRSNEIPVATIQMLVQQGRTFQSLAQQFAVPLTTIRELGTEIRKQRLRYRNTKIRAQHAAGKSYTELAVLFHLSVTRIMGICRA